EILLNAAELEISEAILELPAYSPLVGSVAIEEPTERCKLTFSQSIEPGNYSLRMRFKGTLNDKLRGFYHRSYRVAQGTTKHLAGFGQSIGAFSLSYFEDYYGHPYPGDKLDLLAIPDFAAGAMENLGAITFRETALLVDESTATHAEQERVADVVAHQNAHMW